MAPTLALVTLPYSPRNSFALSARKRKVDCRSFRSSISIPSSSAKRNAMFRIPSCVSLRSIRRESSAGPMSVIVVRIG